MIAAPFVLLVLAASLSSSLPAAEAAPERFSNAQLSVLHDFADYLLATLGGEEMHDAAMAMAMRQQQGNNKAKRNSELLNSLLGLPKNILKSGRK